MKPNAHFPPRFYETYGTSIDDRARQEARKTRNALLIGAALWTAGTILTFLALWGIR